MRAPLMPCCDRKLRTVVARRAPSAILYSRVPRSSAWPSIVIVYCGYCCSHWDCLTSVCVCFRRQIDRVGREVNDIANVLREVALRARRCGSVFAAQCVRLQLFIGGARAEPLPQESKRRQGAALSFAQPRPAFRLSLSSRRQLSGKPLYLFSHSAKRPSSSLSI